MRMSRRHALTRIAAAALSLSLLAGVSAPAFGAPKTPTSPAIAAKRNEADQAQSKLDDLQTACEMRYEELQQIEDALTQTRQRIVLTQSELADANAQLAATQAQLDDRATAIYRNGEVGLIDVFVGATSFNDFITRLDLMRRIGRSDAALVSAVKDAKTRVETAETSLESREAEQVELRDQAQAKSQEYQDAYGQQKAYLATLNTQLKKLIADEQARLAKIAAEQAAAAAAKLKAAAAKAAASGSSASGRSFDSTSLGASHADAVAVAKRYLGVPYVWGGTSPSGFDCSGLVQYSYAQVGVTLPRTSREQFHVGSFIPRDRLDLLKAGDLVFFGYNGDASQIHHVGMYVGSDDFIEAPAAGEVVRISSLTARINGRGDYVGAVRP